ncbi:hypothetical protein K470DRAFT_254242 [Piedraia hortae CBS 480.64]|uniref:Uncharacterized protein n=1 Tax=Piedraia hortae CBS 480.64 TaxID=1314780 RepID=A0A6A7C9P0_9PEZI|nr:hypothetical protein K470DRAFT_254242 [Piedraia hortae CBS 480.64]
MRQAPFWPQLRLTPSSIEIGLGKVTTYLVHDIVYKGREKRRRHLLGKDVPFFNVKPPDGVATRDLNLVHMAMRLQHRQGHKRRKLHSFADAAVVDPCEGFPSILTAPAEDMLFCDDSVEADDEELGDELNAVDNTGLPTPGNSQEDEPPMVKRRRSLADMHSSDTLAEQVILLVGGAMRFAICGALSRHEKGISIPRHVDVKPLAAEAASVWSPGYLSEVSSRAVFLSTIAAVLANLGTRHCKSRGLRNKVQKLCNESPHSVQPAEKGPGISIAVHLWRLLQGGVYNPDAVLDLKSLESPIGSQMDSEHLESWPEDLDSDSGPFVDESLPEPLFQDPKDLEEGLSDTDDEPSSDDKLFCDTNNESAFLCGTVSSDFSDELGKSENLGEDDHCGQLSEDVSGAESCLDPNENGNLAGIKDEFQRASESEEIHSEHLDCLHEGSICSDGLYSQLDQPVNVMAKSSEFEDICSEHSNGLFERSVWPDRRGQPVNEIEKTSELEVVRSDHCKVDGLHESSICSEHEQFSDINFSERESEHCSHNKTEGDNQVDYTYFTESESTGSPKLPYPSDFEHEELKDLSSSQLEVDPSSKGMDEQPILMEDEDFNPLVDEDLVVLEDHELLALAEEMFTVLEDTRLGSVDSFDEQGQSDEASWLEHKKSDGPEEHQRTGLRSDPSMLDDLADSITGSIVSLDAIPSDEDL